MSSAVHRARRVASVIAIGAVVALVAGCGSSSKKGSSTTGGGTSTATTTAHLSGAPIPIGLLAPTDNNIQSVPEVISTAKAAVGWVNDHGGVNGRPLDLRVCETHQSANSVTSCANDLVQQHVVAAIGGGDIGMPAGMPIFTAARVPVIGGAIIMPPEAMGKPPVYRSSMVGMAASMLPAIASFAVRQFHARTVVVVAQDGSQPVINSFIDVALRKLGAPPAQFVGTPQAASDLTPYFQAAAAKHPDVISVFGLPCVPVLQAYKASGTSAKLLQPAQCADSTTLSQAGALAEGNYYLFQNRVPQLDPGNPDIRVFVAAVARYAPNERHATSDFGTATFQGVMNIADLARALPAGQVTAAALQRAVRSTRGQHNWLGLSGTYGCAPPPIPAFPGICSAEESIAQIKGGRLVYAAPGYVDAATLLG